MVFNNMQYLNLKILNVYLKKLLKKLNYLVRSKNLTLRSDLNFILSEILILFIKIRINQNFSSFSKCLKQYVGYF